MCDVRNIKIVLTVILLNQAMKEMVTKTMHHCYDGNDSLKLTCKTNERIYVISERYGVRSIDEGTEAYACVGVNKTIKSCVYETPNDARRYVKMGFDCNGKQNCTIENNYAQLQVQWAFKEIYSTDHGNCSQDIRNMAMEVNYSCSHVPDISVNSMCNSPNLSTKGLKVLHLISPKISGQCKCSIHGSNLHIKVLEMYNKPTVFRISSNNVNCTSRSLYYNEWITCGGGGHISYVQVQILSEYTESRHILRLRLRGEGDITVSCSSTLTETTVGGLSKAATITDVTSTEINFSDREQKEFTQTTLIAVVIACCVLLLILFIGLLFFRSRCRSNHTTSIEKQREIEENEYACADDIIDKKDMRILKQDIKNESNNDEIDTEYHHLALDSQVDRNHSDINHYDYCGEIITSEESEYHHLDNVNNIPSVHPESNYYDHVTTNC